jgi:hypothetical protein
MYLSGSLLVRYVASVFFLFLTAVLFERCLVFCFSVYTVTLRFMGMLMNAYNLFQYCGRMKVNDSKTLE